MDYTESSEVEDEPNENCHTSVDHDFTTDHPNDKDPLICGNQMPADAQPSSDIEDNKDNVPLSKLTMLEGKMNEKDNKKEDFKAFWSDDDNRSNSLVDDIISKLDKDPMVSKSMEVYWLENSAELSTDAIHTSAVIVSETDTLINSVESTSDTTIMTAKSDSESDKQIVIVWEKKQEVS